MAQAPDSRSNAISTRHDVPHIEENYSSCRDIQYAAVEPSVVNYITIRPKKPFGMEIPCVAPSALRRFAGLAVARLRTRKYSDINA